MQKTVIIFGVILILIGISEIVGLFVIGLGLTVVLIGFLAIVIGVLMTKKEEIPSNSYEITRLEKRLDRLDPQGSTGTRGYESNEPSDRCQYCGKWWKKSYLASHEERCPDNPHRKNT